MNNRSHCFFDFDNVGEKRAIVENEVTNSNNKNISKENDLFIEKTIASFFGLNSTDYETIYETLHAADQLIPIKRLLECDTKEIFQ